MTEKLTITRTDDRVPILHLNGDLDASTEEILLGQARLAKDSGARFLLLDLSGLKIITSAGLRAIHNVFKIFTPLAEVETWQKNNPGVLYKSPNFKLAGASTDVYYVLSLTGFIQNILIFPDLQEAILSFEM